jgi:hypothetical protein
VVVNPTTFFYFSPNNKYDAYFIYHYDTFYFSPNSIVSKEITMKKKFFDKNQRMEKVIRELARRYYNGMGANRWDRECEYFIGQLIAWSCSDPTSLTFGKSECDLFVETFCMDMKLKSIMKVMRFRMFITTSEYRMFLRQYRGWNK